MSSSRKVYKRTFSKYDIISSNPSVIALKSLFNKYDVNGDECLDAKELASLLTTDIGLSEEQAETYIYILYKNGKTFISFEEFQDWMNNNDNLKDVTDATRYYYLRKAIEMFQRYDSNDNFSLDREELRLLLLETGGKEEHLEITLKQLDKDGNGLISFKEFLEWLNWTPLNDIFN
nr:probable calcium-binding protein CML25 [Hydra vulgaris]